jgi:hypothetical protein
MYVCAHVCMYVCHRSSSISYLCTYVHAHVCMAKVIIQSSNRLSTKIYNKKWQIHTIHNKWKAYQFLQATCWLKINVSNTANTLLSVPITDEMRAKYCPPQTKCAPTIVYHTRNARQLLSITDKMRANYCLSQTKCAPSIVHHRRNARQFFQATSYMLTRNKHIKQGKRTTCQTKNRRFLPALHHSIS